MTTQPTDYGSATLTVPRNWFDFPDDPDYDETAYATLLVVAAQELFGPHIDGVRIGADVRLGIYPLTDEDRDRLADLYQRLIEEDTQ